MVWILKALELDYQLVIYFNWFIKLDLDLINFSFSTYIGAWLSSLFQTILNFFEFFSCNEAISKPLLCVLIDYLLFEKVLTCRGSEQLYISVENDQVPYRYGLTYFNDKDGDADPEPDRVSFLLVQCSYECTNCHRNRNERMSDVKVEHYVKCNVSLACYAIVEPWAVVIKLWHTLVTVYTMGPFLTCICFALFTVLVVISSFRGKYNLVQIA